MVGTDISPIQPTWIPPNLRFEIDDATQEWTFGPDSFDYIHMRYLFGSIADWQALFDQAYAACTPGGWVESFEMSSVARCDDGSVKKDSALETWSEAFVEGGKKFGRSFTIVDEDVQQKCMEKSGFTEVTVKDIKVCFHGPPTTANGILDDRCIAVSNWPVGKGEKVQRHGHVQPRSVGSGHRRQVVLQPSFVQFEGDTDTVVLHHQATCS